MQSNDQVETLTTKTFREVVRKDISDLQSKLTMLNLDPNALGANNKHAVPTQSENSGPTTRDLAQVIFKTPYENAQYSFRSTMP